MLGWLAYADSGDSSNSNLLIILISVAVLIVVGGLGFVPVAIAWRRRHRYAEVIGAGAVLWGLLAAGSLIYTASARLNWSRERMLRIESGYYDPRDLSDAPKWPWMAWGGLGVGYGVVVTISLARGDGSARR